jgi:4-hydroxyphenylacetate decarboxylase small subunit
MDQLHKNQDCRNYAPVDVVKGICHITKEVVLADGLSCSCFTSLPKCKLCQNYTPSHEEYIGTCKASPAKPMSYPDLIGVTCEQFMWKKD